MYYSWSRVISWLPVSVAAVILRRRFRQLKTWKNEHAKKKGKQQEVMREESVLTVAKTFFFVLHGGFTEWQPVTLADIAAFLPLSPSVSFCLSENVCCVHSSYTTSCVCTTAQLSQSLAMWAVLWPHGTVCVCTPPSYTSSAIWSCEWSSGVNHSLNWHSVSFIGFAKIPLAEEEKAFIYNTTYYSKERLLDRDKYDVKPLLGLLLPSES